MNTTTITKALQAARECIHADRTSFADCSIGPGNTMEPDDAEALAEYDAVLALVDEALAALQPQPAAAVSDEEISRLWSWSATAEAERTATTQQHAFAYALLALRPQAVPMSHHDVVVMQFKLGQKFNDMTIGDLQTVVTAVEAHHGITAQGEQP